MTQANNVAIESSQINSSGVLTVPGGGTGLSTVGTSGYFLQSNGTGLQYAAVPATTPGGSNGYVQFNSSSTFGGSANLFWDNTNARLGIGISSPSYQLQNYISANQGLHIYNQNPNTGTGAYAAISSASNTNEFTFRAYSSTFNTFAHAGISLAGWSEIWGGTLSGSGPSGLLLGVDSSSPIAFATNNTERMRIASNGYIGINTSAPTGQVDINRGTVGIRCPNAAGAAVQFAGGKTGSGSTVTGTMLTVNFSAVSYTAITLHIFSTCYQLNGGGSANSGMIGAYDIVNIIRQAATYVSYNITRVSGPSLASGISPSWTVTGAIASNIFTLTGSSPNAGQTGWTFTGYMVYGGQGSSATNIVLTSYDDGTAQVWGA
jgi:hypothetical protein